MCVYGGVIKGESDRNIRPKEQMEAEGMSADVTSCMFKQRDDMSQTQHWVYNASHEGRTEVMKESNRLRQRLFSVTIVSRN